MHACIRVCARALACLYACILTYVCIRAWMHACILVRWHSITFKCICASFCIHKNMCPAYRPTWKLAFYSVCAFSLGLHTDTCQLTIGNTYKGIRYWKQYLIMLLCTCAFACALARSPACMHAYLRIHAGRKNKCKAVIWVSWNNTNSSKLGENSTRKYDFKYHNC